MAAILETKGLEKSFGSVTAAVGIDVAVDKHEVVGIIGANGAGKTTFINMVTGFVKPDRGRIFFHGRDITALSPRAVTNLGISRSFQIPQVFTSASVADNLLIALGAAERDRFSFWRPLRRKNLLESAAGQMKLFQIADFADHTAATLPQGIRKLLDIAMAVVRRPEILLLDEPTSGVSAEEKFQIMDTVMSALKAQEVTVLFVEHDMEIIARYAQRVIAFYEGTIIADGATEEVLAHEQVRKYVIGEDLRGGDSQAAPARGNGVVRIDKEAGRA
ncbi:MAG: ABC transporter ATP-binding protein [SAR324 cluster bacterium]|nr:ABC transporter ATP-binding protein [SAR324 cluster bacterium]